MRNTRRRNARRVAVILMFAVVGYFISITAQDIYTALVAAHVSNGVIWQIALYYALAWVYTMWNIGAFAGRYFWK